MITGRAWYNCGKYAGGEMGESKIKIVGKRKKQKTQQHRKGNTTRRKYVSKPGSKPKQALSTVKNSRHKKQHDKKDSIKTSNKIQ